MLKLHGLARLGRNAEVRYTASGDAACTLALAFTYGQKDPDGKRPTQWVDATLWGKRAEGLAEHLVKGRALVVALSDPHIEEYTTRDGRTGTKIVARVDDLAFAGSRDDATPAEPKTTAEPKKTHGELKRPAAATTAAAFGDMEDDVPY
jgi:single-strand DNA-binding protein